MNTLEKYGLTDCFIKEATLYPNFNLARIIAQYQGLYKVITLDGELLAEISGKLRYETEELAKYPAVGDFVMVTQANHNDKAIIHHILHRKSIFLRTAVGLREQAQIIATNIDNVFICMSLNNNFNLNRLERYLSIAWDSGATPVIILTKSDLCNNLQEVMTQVEEVSAFSDIITTSIYDNDASNKLASYCTLGVTSAFIGSSGVGKSTLINQLLGETILSTKEINKDDKGKHTTTGREMFPSSFGGVLIDTPGMRELGAESVDLSKSFADIEVLATTCKFKNCSHLAEPGCGILKAIKDGSLDARRLANYFKLKRECGYDGLSSHGIEVTKLDRMFKDVGGMKNARKFIKQGNKRN